MNCYRVHDTVSGTTWRVNAGETVLEAALREGYLFPHHCRNAVCGTCKGRILEGQVTYKDLLFGISDAEREEGWALFCAAYPQSDLLIQVDGLVSHLQFSVKRLMYSVHLLQAITPEILRVIFKPPANDFIQYYAGQYIEVLRKDTNPLPFSIANAPFEEKYIELHIRVSEPAAKALLDHLQATGTVSLAGPYGHCIYANPTSLPTILLAGGTGFAPCKAVIEMALAEGLLQPLILYWGAKTFADLYFHTELTRWAEAIPHFHYIPVLSEAHWQGRMGLVHEAVINDYKDLSAQHIYAAGPPEMIYAAQKAFIARGLPRFLFQTDLADLR